MLEDTIIIRNEILVDALPGEVVYNVLGNEDGTYVCDEQDGGTLMEL